MNVFFPLLNACQLLQSVRASHGGDGQHVSHITSVKDFYEGPRIRQNITELPARSFNKVLTGKSEWTAAHRILTRVHESPESLIHSFFAEGRRPVIPVQVRWRVLLHWRFDLDYSPSAATAQGASGRPSWRTRTSNNHWTRSVRQTDLRAGRKQRDGWIVQRKFLSNQSVCDSVNTKQWPKKLSTATQFHRWKSPILNLALSLSK